MVYYKLLDTVSTEMGFEKKEGGRRIAWDSKDCTHKQGMCIRSN